MLLKGSGHLWVYRIGTRRPIVDRPFPIDTTVPRSTIRYPFAWTGLRAPTGRYTYSVQLAWDGGSTSKKGAFTVR